MSELSRRQFVGILTAATGGLLTRSSTSAALPVPHAGERPNIIYISADDLGYGDLSGYGRADYQTPVLDRFGAEGMRFMQAYAIAPICTPTRVGFMTGRYPARHPIGLKEPLTTSEEHRRLGLDPAHPTVSSLLKRAGYTTALFGKWHLGFRPEFQPGRHGFDEFFGPLSGAVDYVAHRDMSGNHDLYYNDRPVHHRGYLTDLVTEHCVRFIRRRRQPFFLSVQGTAPHWPWQQRGDAPVPQGKRLNEDEPADRFPEMVKALDQGIGQVLRAVEEARLADRTLVIFTSDNGGGRYSNMAGLARGKGHVWEGGIRVPAMARWPGRIPAGVTTTQVATTLDWSATVLAAAGVAPAASHPLDGISLLSCLTGAEPPRERTVFWRRGENGQGAVREGGWKYLWDKDGEYLFDLVHDPGERKDLKVEEPARFARLKVAYAGWHAQMLPAT
ncbi:MAG: sulfatase-like hydrolase/transferase [Gemmatimonadales bacterium]